MGELALSNGFSPSYSVEFRGGGVSPRSWVEQLLRPPYILHAERPEMKRYVADLECLYAELLKDAAYAYPALGAEFSKDLARLVHLSKSRGLPFFMVDLPALGKHLDRCLSERQYKPSHLPISRQVSRGVVIPKLFRGLYLLIFDSNGDLKEDADIQAVFFLRQLLLCAKKAPVSCPPEATSREIDEFVQVDSSLPSPPNHWATPEYRGDSSDHAGFAADVELLSRVSLAFPGQETSILNYLDRIAGVISTSLGHYDPLDWDFKHGPGAVSNVRRDENRYRFKFWPSTLETAFPFADCCFHNYGAWVDEAQDEVGEKDFPVLQSRLIAVLKTLTKPRLIASEPYQHMWCQQNLRSYMYERVHHSWLGAFLNFRSQERNQAMALQGSNDGSFATIDLSAASDRVSCHVVGNLFRGNPPLLRALMASRTRRCQIQENWIIDVRKYSTMGNATTFPVQSLVFLAVALTCIAKGLKLIRVTPSELKRLADQVSVFGDDIIVPERYARDVTLLLEALGFKVNAAKSFLTGPFKESCGVDAFRGHDVTPAYWQGPCDKSPESIASNIEVANNFYKRFLVHASAWMERSCRGIRFPRRIVGSGAPGYDSYLQPPLPPTRRWNKDLQVVEVRVPVFTSAQEIRRQRDNTSLLQYFTERPSPRDPWKAGLRLRPLLKIRKRWVPTAQFSRTEE
ncbi:TPA_asm: RNA-directed RNA polymerase [ssRNA phage SRR7976325_28]|uniref:RNA-directed RNA polymerase n=1 Tax=ssRNA phage SRR7976325_28 TaxID=2786716 RepID=A0A8S5L5A6_9VIRU|nr:RNA-directed RNA polymerase [ssRNA phage SRR7976325_28]DAD52755.1 TPA_asm: RNA-directed RNA polymerase [ssRNA phage SRR7976325_28]